MLETELQRTKEQLIRIERLAGLGTMAAGVGHELNNVTSVLDAAIYEIKSALTGGIPPSLEGIDMLETVSQHLRIYGKELLHIGKPFSEHIERVDLREIANNTVTMLRTLGRSKHARVQVQAPDHPVYLNVDRTRMEQVLVNLVGNAADALEDVRGRDRAIAVAIECPPGSREATCQVQDNGTGIPNDKLTEIFEPYYTTKAAGHGTGLGLPVCKHILESYGGSLSVVSTLGAGSTFTFQLPVG
jgi:C4-dicarboxylate-specific signal transduction histidine kinase